MGHGESKSLSEQKELSRDFTIDSRVKEENLTFLTKRQTHGQFLLREIIYTEEREYKDMVNRLEQRKTINSPFLTKLQRLQHFKEENLCSNYFRIYALWEYPRKTLAEEINYRALLKQPYDGNELRTLIVQLSEGLVTYEQNKKSHECLTTKTILLSPDNSIKIVDILALPSHPNLQVVYQKRNTKNTYLSPQHCKVIASQQFDNSKGNPFKQDIFIIGMIVLECALLERQDDCYENNWEGIKWNKINQKLTNVENRYGRQIRIIIEQMLDQHSEKRIDWRTIIRRLDPKSSLSIQNQVKNSIVGQSFIRQSFQNSTPPVQRVSVPAPIIQSIRKVDPKSSYVFTYNSRQVNREPLQSQIPMQIVHPIERISYEQGPHIRVVEPVQIMQHIVPPAPLKIVHQGPPVVIAHSNPPRPIRIQPSMSSKFTPIALTDAKPKVETVPTAINNNQNGYIATVNNEFKINSPTIQQANEPLPPDVKNFSLHISDPIYSIDEYAEGKRYEGYKVNGKKQGEGKFYLDNKLCFSGHWKDDLMQGEGKLYYQSGSLAYDGNFEKDRFHGYGKLFNQSPEVLLSDYNYQNFEDIEEFWISYEGYFENDLKEGRGELILTNGEHFQGNFHIDCVHGEGIYTTKDGKEIHGIWHENKLQKRLN